ncbi:hypothetical protein PIB30_106010 [Stylosanthes scabra]|uniref:Retrotransposon gag domain-containing protein n=1 Tax=Stylosanthes scabra TaxID=79078 RepID=A0ABU6WWZ4_9FABA|nr:hypothetical protein [Stylosanthes scabra]
MAAAMRDSAAATNRAVDQMYHNRNPNHNNQNIPEEEAEQYVEFATYMLQGKAQYWWVGVRRILQQDNAGITWDMFKTEFYKMYFP